MNVVLLVNVGLLCAVFYLVALLWRRISNFERQVKDLADQLGRDSSEKTKH